MADSSPGMIWLTNPEGGREYFNRAWLNFRGRTAEEDRGDGWKSGVHPDDLTYLDAILSEGLRTRSSLSAEYRLQYQDGTYRYVMGSAVPRYTDDGHFLGFVGTCMDVTAMREAENERLAMQAQVQESARVESIARLAGGVAHEFNNLLTGVLGYANLAQLEPGLSQEVRDYLARIEEGTLKAADLTRKMLSFSGRAPSVRSLQSLTAVVEDTLPLLRATMPKRLSLSTQLARELPSIVADPAQVQQVLANLFTNAVEAVDESGGIITVCTGFTALDAKQLRTMSADEDLVEGSYVFLRVTDNGCGIPEENMVRIFDPFFSTKFLGRGLGLAAIQGIVRGHGGWFQVHSAPGHGATSSYVRVSTSMYGTPSGTGAPGRLTVTRSPPLSSEPVYGPKTSTLSARLYCARNVAGSTGLTTTNPFAGIDVFAGNENSTPLVNFQTFAGLAGS